MAINHNFASFDITNRIIETSYFEDLVKDQGLTADSTDDDLEKVADAVVAEAQSGYFDLDGVDYVQDPIDIDWALIHEQVEELRDHMQRLMINPVTDGATKSEATSCAAISPAE